MIGLNILVLSSSALSSLVIYYNIFVIYKNKLSQNFPLSIIISSIPYLFSHFLFSLINHNTILILSFLNLGISHIFLFHTIFKFKEQTPPLINI